MANNFDVLALMFLRSSTEDKKTNFDVTIGVEAEVPGVGYDHLTLVLFPND
jgi:hypothetical protein